MTDDPIERRRTTRQRQAVTRILIAGAALAVLLVAAGVSVFLVVKRSRQPARPAAEAPPAVVPRPAAPEKPPESKRYFLAAENNADTKSYPRYREKALAVFHPGQLTHEFQVNELKANATYRGKPFYISGIVARLTNTEGEVTLALGHIGFGEVYCQCSARDPLLLKVRADTPGVGPQAVPASSVLLEGTCVNSGLFKDCRVIDVTNRAP